MTRFPSQQGGGPAGTRDQPDLAGVAAIGELTEMPAEQLARRAQSGCAAAFTELTRRYRPRLVRFLEKRLSGHRSDAEDVAQDALIKAWQRIERYDPRYQFTTWLYTIAARVGTDCLRRRKPLAELEQVPERIQDDRSDVQEMFVRSEQADNIWSTAREVLSESQFSVLWLRYSEGLAVKEVAQVLRKTTIGVRVLLHRSRAALQPHMLKFIDLEVPGEDVPGSGSDSQRSTKHNGDAA